MLAADFFEQSALACQKLGRRGILLTKFDEQIPKVLPADVIHVPYAPFSQLLPRCAAIVHHGGIGTTSQALRAGIPQVIVPLAHDQPDNASRVKKLGVGSIIPCTRYQAQSAENNLRFLLDSVTIQSIVQQYCGTILER